MLTHVRTQAMECRSILDDVVSAAADGAVMRAAYRTNELLAATDRLVATIEDAADAQGTPNGVVRKAIFSEPGRSRVHDGQV
jgi:hypothetical protein